MKLEGEVVLEGTEGVGMGVGGFDQNSLYASTKFFCFHVLFYFVL